MNSCVNWAPWAFAPSSRSCFTVSVWAWMPAAARAGATMRSVTTPESSAPSMTLPALDTATNVPGGEPTPGAAAARPAMVPGVTKTFGASLPKPRPKPATPRRGTIRSTVNAWVAP